MNVDRSVPFNESQLSSQLLLWDQAHGDAAVNGAVAVGGGRVDRPLGVRHPAHKLIYCFCTAVTTGLCPAYSCHATHICADFNEDDPRFDDATNRFIDDVQALYYVVQQPHNGNRVSAGGSIGATLLIIIG